MKYGPIQIPEPIPSQNILHRMEHWAYKKLRDRLHWWVKIGRVELAIPKVGKEACRKLTIYRYAKRENYMLDRGNFIGGCKPLLDACRLEGLIYDDREKYLIDEYHQRLGTPRTEVYVEEATRTEV